MIKTPKNWGKTMFKAILTPEHKMWKKFVNAMMKRKGECDNTTRGTRAILQNMQGIDVEGTLRFFENLGGYCDCEVLLNAVLKYDTYERARR